MYAYTTHEEARALASVFDLSDEELALLDQFIDADADAGWRRIVSLADASMKPETSAKVSWLSNLLERWDRMLLASRISSHGLATLARGAADNWHNLPEQKRRELVDVFGSDEAAIEALGDSSREYATVRSKNGVTSDLALRWSGNINRVSGELNVDISVTQPDAEASGVRLAEGEACYVEVTDGNKPLISLGPLYARAEQNRVRLNTIFLLPDDILSALGDHTGGLPASGVRVLIEEAQ